MVRAYSMFVNGGKKIEPSMIDRIQDRHGKTIYAHDKRPCVGCGSLIKWEGQEVPEIPDAREPIADPRHIHQIVSIMQGVVQRGTGVRLKSLNRPLAGKTGTTNQSKDTWFIGYTPDLVVGIFVGYDEPSPMGKKETGSRVALPIFKSFMEEAMKGVTPVPFREPEGIRHVEVNRLTGTRAKPNDEDLIWEVFVKGTEPGDKPMMFNGQEIREVRDLGSSLGDGANMGTGGIY